MKDIDFEVNNKKDKEGRRRYTPSARVAMHSFTPLVLVASPAGLQLAEARHMHAS